MKATLLGYKAITSAKGEFTIAYVTFSDDEIKGQGSKDCFLKGHPLNEKMIGTAVNVEISIENGRVQGITAA